jgi:hypothetical protein
MIDPSLPLRFHAKPPQARSPGDKLRMTEGERRTFGIAARISGVSFASDLRVR